MSRFCFAVAFGLLLFIRPSESDASIQWEWTSESLDIVGVITIDDSAPGFAPNGWLGKSALSWNFVGRDGYALPFQSMDIWFGSDPYDPSTARVEGFGGEFSWNEFSLLTKSIGFFLDDRKFGTPPTPRIQAFLDAYAPELAVTPDRVRATDGTLRVVTPEPATIAVWSLLIATVGGVYWKRRE